MSVVNWIDTSRSSDPHNITCVLTHHPHSSLVWALNFWDSRATQRIISRYASLKISENRYLCLFAQTLGWFLICPNRDDFMIPFTGAWRLEAGSAQMMIRWWHRASADWTMMLSSAPHPACPHSPAEEIQRNHDSHCDCNANEPLASLFAKIMIQC